VPPFVFLKTREWVSPLSFTQNITHIIYHKVLKIAIVFMRFL